MQGRWWSVTAVLIGALTLVACGGGGSGGGNEPPPAQGEPAIAQFTADRTTYFIGERARLTASFTNGTGRIVPGNIPVQSGQTVDSTALEYGPNELQLVVTNSSGQVTRDITVTASYRERLRAIEMPFERAEHHAARLSDGRVLIFGGDDPGNIFPASIWVFDPATERFTDFGVSLSSGRVGFVSVSLNDGNILVAGGERSLTGAPNAELINPNARSVVPTAGGLNIARTFAAGTLLMDGKVIVAGGTGLAASTSVEVYDPETSRFTVLSGSLHVGRYSHTVVRIDQRRVLIYGGFTYTGEPAPPELYDPVAQTSTRLTPFEDGTRANHVAHTMRDGGVLIIGGEDDQGIPLTSVLRFDPATNRITLFANLATARSFLELGRLADARIIVTGGVVGLSSGDVTNTTETLALDATRRDGPLMSRSRWHHTVTGLSDGRLLIVGGLDESRRTMASAEIFE